MRTVRHFWPQLRTWMSRVPDTRFEPLVVYDRAFLLWWGLLLFCLKLGSRRQLDFDLRDPETFVLENINRLAGTTQFSLPVHKTLAHFLSHVGPVALAAWRTLFMRRLIRMKALDASRLQGTFVTALDGTGHLIFEKPHCEHCLTQKHESKTVYFHPVLEAKLVDCSGLALSIGTEFIENRPSHGLQGKAPGGDVQEYSKVKQDCELKAFARIAPTLKSHFPQTPLCISADSEFGCGTAMQISKDHGWDFVFVFKPGRTPALWEDFLGVLKLTPENSLRIRLPGNVRQSYRWANGLRHRDSYNREHIVDAILCEETREATTTTFAWLTSFGVTANNVAAIAQRGGRVRSKIENQGFNIQKNSGLNLEHAYSFGPDTIKSFYYLLQIAHIILQLVEKGSLLKKLAAQYRKSSPRGLFGSWENIAKQLRECFRCYYIPDDAFDVLTATACQIRLDTG